MLTFSRACPLARVPLFAHNTLHPHLFLTLLSPFSHLHLFLTLIFFSHPSFLRSHFPHRFFSYHHVSSHLHLTIISAPFSHRLSSSPCFFTFRAPLFSRFISRNNIYKPPCLNHPESLSASWYV